MVVKITTLTTHCLTFELTSSKEQQKADRILTLSCWNFITTRNLLCKTNPVMGMIAYVMSFLFPECVAKGSRFFLGVRGWLRARPSTGSQRMSRAHLDLVTEDTQAGLSILNWRNIKPLNHGIGRSTTNQIHPLRHRPLVVRCFHQGSRNRVTAQTSNGTCAFAASSAKFREDGDHSRCACCCLLIPCESSFEFLCLWESKKPYP